MSIKTRLIILALCIVLFLTVTPYLLLYSIGYRIDFASGNITSTGGIYVKAIPEDAQVTIDSKIGNKTSLFSAAVFVQNLLPKTHAVLIQRAGYHDYQKNLIVEPKQVTKLENVILFKKDIQFTQIENSADYTSLSPDGQKMLVAQYQKNKTTYIQLLDLNTEEQKTISIQSSLIYKVQWSNDSTKALLKTPVGYILLETTTTPLQATLIPGSITAQDVSFDRQNASHILFIKSGNLYTLSQITPIIENVLSYYKTGRQITWLAGDGFLYYSSDEGQTREKISTAVFPSKQKSTYEILSVGTDILLKADDFLYQLDPITKEFKMFESSVSQIRLSPHKDRLLYCNTSRTAYYDYTIGKKIPLNKSQVEIIDCNWINNDYIFFTTKDQVILSEIDARGNINTANVFKSPLQTLQTSFNFADKKLYILNQKNIIASEQLIP